MPNWCENSLEIVGPKDLMVALWEEVNKTEDKELLQAMVPIPEELRNTQAPRDTPNWYDWSIENWGTKWDVSELSSDFMEYEDGTCTLIATFDTAWAPPLKAYDAFRVKHPEVHICAQYYEPGCGFMGEYVDGQDTEIEDISQIAYDLYKGKCNNELAKRLEELFNITSNYEDLESLADLECVEA